MLTLIFGIRASEPPRAWRTTEKAGPDRVNTGNTKGTDHCIIGNINTPSDDSHLIGCIGEIIGFYRSLTDTETLYIHKHLMKKWGITD